MTKAEITGFKCYNWPKICGYIIAIYLILGVTSTYAEMGFQTDSIEKSARFSGEYSDFGKDVNMNELYDFIVVTVWIGVFSPGVYTVNGSLLNSQENEILNASNSTRLKLGIDTIQLKFQDAKATGKRFLKNLTIYDSNGNPLDHIDDAYKTKAEYNDLEHGPNATAWLTGNYSDHGIDTNGDGLYDYLDFDVGTYIQSPGEYSLMGYLHDQQDREVSWTIDHRNFTSGEQTMHLIFDGKSLGSQKASGPYRLRNVTLSSGSSYTGMRICDHVQNAYNTSAYSYSAFKK